MYFLNHNRSTNVGVNYEIPSKYLQYGNEILNTTNWVFDGTTTGYPLIDQAGDAYTPVNDQLVNC